MAFEIELIKWLQRLSSPFLNIVSIIGSHFFSYAMVAIVAVCLFLFYNKKFAIYFTFVVVAGVLANLAIKYLIARQRPFEVDSAIVNIYNSFGYSYPSGHSVTAMGIALALGFAFRDDFGTKRGHFILLGLVLFLLLNMLNRMYLGQHFLTDILAGYMFMFGVCWFAYLIIPNMSSINYKPLIKLKRKINATQKPAE